MRNVTFRPEARTELLAARRWYGTARPGLGAAFVDEIDRLIDQVRRAPDLFPVVHRDIRRAMVRRFPYGIFYRHTSASILVLSVSHLKRNPRRWQSRA